MMSRRTSGSSASPSLSRNRPASGEPPRAVQARVTLQSTKSETSLLRNSTALSSRSKNSNPQRVGGSLMRVYRDTRFSKNKLPYKTNIGIQFRHEQAKDVHSTGYYVHIEPKLILIGCGIWRPPSPALAKIRAFIDDNPNAWKRARDDSAIRKRFGGIEGERLKRPPRGYAADHPLIEDLKQKSFYVMQEHRPGLANSPDLVDETIAAFGDADPLMRYLCMALGAEF